MNNMLSPKAMHLAVLWALEGAVAVDDTTPQGTLADDVERLVWGAAVRPIVLALGLEGGIKERLRGGIEGPNLDRFINEIGKNWSEPWIT